LFGNQQEGKYGAVLAMHDLFRGLMWRSTKAQVADELGLPPQDERFEWLRFSPIEAHFYRQQHERCAVRAREVIANYRKHVSSTRSSAGRRPGARNEPDTNANAATVTSGVGSTLSDTSNLQHVQNGDLGIKAPPDELEDRLLSNKEAEKLLDQLRWLRQACVHPQVGSAGIRSLQRSPMTMDEILEV
jgi:E3 ubiquitin-protein ligase SHPRH